MISDIRHSITLYNGIKSVLELAQESTFSEPTLKGSVTSLWDRVNLLGPYSMAGCIHLVVGLVMPSAVLLKLSISQYLQENLSIRQSHEL